MFEVLKYVSENWTASHVFATLFILWALGNYIIYPLTVAIRDTIKGD